MPAQSGLPPNKRSPLPFPCELAHPLACNDTRPSDFPQRLGTRNSTSTGNESWEQRRRAEISGLRERTKLDGHSSQRSGHPTPAPQTQPIQYPTDLPNESTRPAGHALLLVHSAAARLSLFPPSSRFAPTPVVRARTTRGNKHPFYFFSLTNSRRIRSSRRSPSQPPRTQRLGNGDFSLPAHSARRNFDSRFPTPTLGFRDPFTAPPAWSPRSFYLSTDKTLAPGHAVAPRLTSPFRWPRSL